MNAIALLKKQHREVKALFRQIEKAPLGKKQRLFQTLADQLAVHAAIEEKHFYPRAMAPKTEDILREAVEEHLGVKRVLADIMASGPNDPQYTAKLTVLKEDVTHHAEEEEESLFPKAQRILGSEELASLGEIMQSMAEELLSKGSPRDAVPSDTSAPAPLPAVGRRTGIKGLARSSANGREASLP